MVQIGRYETILSWSSPCFSFSLAHTIFVKGLENICLDIEFMLKRKPGVYWRICWACIIPIVLLMVFIYFLITLEELTYESKPYPAYVIGKVSEGSKNEKIILK